VKYIVSGVLFDKGVGKVAGLLGGLAKRVFGKSARRAVADIGNKLDYVFGRATGAAHNIDRSKAMLAQMERIGLSDNAASRDLMLQHLDAVVNDVSNIVRTQANGRIVRESLLMGPNGGVKIESIWEGTKLITLNLLGG
jgi:hypothetical protein